MDELLITIEELLRKDCRVQSTQGSYLLVEEKEPDYPSTKIKQKGKLLLYQLDR